MSNTLITGFHHHTIPHDSSTDSNGNSLQSSNTNLAGILGNLGVGLGGFGNATKGDDDMMSAKQNMPMYNRERERELDRVSMEGTLLTSCHFSYQSSFSNLP